MTNAPIPVANGRIGKVKCLTVDARALHEVLCVKSIFANWITRRISKYGFIQGQDFVVFSKNGKNSEDGRPSQDYRITLDMAKELCMVENNENGRIARRYFIECERQLLAGLKATPRQKALPPAQEPPEPPKQSTRELWYEAYMAWAENDVNGQEPRKRFRETSAWLERNVSGSPAWRPLHALGMLLEAQHKINAAIYHTMMDIEPRVPR